MRRWVGSGRSGLQLAVLEVPGSVSPGYVQSPGPGAAELFPSLSRSWQGWHTPRCGPVLRPWGVEGPGVGTCGHKSSVSAC